MDLALLVYAISILQPIGTVLMAVMVISVMVIAGLMIYRFAECTQEQYYQPERNKQRAENAVWSMQKAGTALKVLIPTVIALVLLPAPKTAYIMVGAYAAQKVVENKSVQDTSGKVLTLINQKLDQYIEDGIKEATEVPAKVEKKVKEKVKKETE